MRSILVLADRGPASKPRLETALSLARAARGHLTVMVDTPVARFMAMDAMGSAYLAADAIRDALTRDDAFAAELAQHLAREDVPFDMVRCEDEPVEALCSAARLADVIVLSRGSDYAGQVAVSAKTPVLLVPQDRILTMPVGCACIGWDGGEEAAVALRIAAPMLAHCTEVHVITVAEKPGGLAATDALRYLSRHGVKAELVEMPRVGSVEESLAAGVARVKGDLLVMGAFGHSRLREFLLGGVTRYFLQAEDGPALLLAR